MRKTCFLFLILFFLISSLVWSNPSFFLKPEASIAETELVNLKVSASLTADTRFSNFGFSSKAITSEADLPATPIPSDKVNLSNLDIASGCFANRPLSGDALLVSTGLYAYWAIFSDKDTCPDVYLSIKEPMKSSTVNSVVNWKVSWDDGFISSSGTREAKIFDHNKDKNAKSGRLNNFVGSKELTIQTTDPYWKSDLSTYSSDLWILVETRK